MLQDLGLERTSSKSLLLTVFFAASKVDRLAMGMLRAALVLVLVWIGGLKFVNYEADSIVPLVANSPLMSFLYHLPAEYRSHMNKEGGAKPATSFLAPSEWHLFVFTRFRDRHCVHRYSDCTLSF